MTGNNMVLKKNNPTGLFLKIYGLICGELPNYRFYHSRWLSYKDVNKDLKRVLPQLAGKVLDVGCADKPYERWLEKKEEYVGVDIAAGGKVDCVISLTEPWPLHDDYFDSVMCTQVLEHVENFDDVFNEMTRVLKPGGTCVVTVPFIYNEHASPHDFRRFSLMGLQKIFSEKYEIVESKKQGAFGSTMGLLFLNFLALYKPTRYFFGILLPLWILLCGAVNVLCFLVDKLDGTAAFYTNVMIVAKKRR